MGMLTEVQCQYPAKFTRLGNGKIQFIWYNHAESVQSEEAET